MFQCYTVTLREHKMPLPCSVLWSDNHMIIKACSRNILLQANYSIILTNNNLWLLFSRDRSYEGIIFDKSFICNFVLHFYESHTNVSISIQSFTCHHTVIWATKNQPKGSWWAFLSRPTFVPQARKVGKMFLFFEMLFYPLSLNFWNS